MGAEGETFVLDMGEPVKIVDLAREFIWLSGRSELDIGIEFTGLRSGEDLHEELLVDNESTLPTTHPRLRITKSRPTLDATWMKALFVWLQQGNPGAERVQHELMQKVLLPDGLGAPNSISDVVFPRTNNE